MTLDSLKLELSSLKTFQFRQVIATHCHGGGESKCSSKESKKIALDSTDSVVSDIVKARENIQLKLASSKGSANENLAVLSASVTKIESVVASLASKLESLTKRFDALESQLLKPKAPAAPQTTKAPPKPAAKGDDDDDDIDLFGSDDEEQDKAAEELRQKRLADYAQKKSKKPAAVAKSSIILDVKPWDDETDMAEMQRLVRTIEMDGLVWGAANLEPLAYGIKKLRIVCVIEDDKVSVEELTEKIEEFEEHVQSVDIAAFNKV